MRNEEEEALLIALYTINKLRKEGLVPVERFIIPYKLSPDNEKRALKLIETNAVSPKKLYECLEFLDQEYSN